MAINQLFKVATEFKFEVGAALLGTKQLTNAVGSLSAAADDALISFKKLGIQGAITFGLGTSSLLGVLTKAVNVSDKFRTSQLDLANIMAANKDKLIGPIDTFNDRMQLSATILKSISKQARQFSLPTGQFVQLTKLLSAQLVPKGLAGRNFGTAQEISRRFLKAAPTLGIDPGEATGQLQRTIGGGASGGDTLFRRLTLETKAFKEFVGAAKKFNQLDPAKRVKTLVEGLKQLTSSTDNIEARTKTLTGSLRRFSDLLGGLDSILKPLGDVIIPPLVKVISLAADILDSQGRRVVTAISKIVKGLIENPKKLLINLLQLRNLSKDLENTKLTLSLIGLGTALLALPSLIIRFRVALLSVLGPRLLRALAIASVKARSIILSTLSFGLSGLKKVFSFAFLKSIPKGLLSLATKVLPALVFFATKLFLPLTAILILFQVIARAKAIADVRLFGKVPEFIAMFTEKIQRLTVAIGIIFSPIAIFIEALAQLIATFFIADKSISVGLFLFEKFVQLMEFFAEVVIGATAILQGFFFVILQFIENIKSGNPFSTKGLGDAFQGGISDIVDKNKDFLVGKTAAVVNQVTNIGTVKIANTFKEQLEPDRIAFALKEQLIKASQNPTQARGGSFTRANLTVSG